MARRCQICQKGISTGHQVSHSNIKNKRAWHPNLQKIKVFVKRSPRRMLVCTKCLRSGKVHRAV